MFQHHNYATVWEKGTGQFALNFVHFEATITPRQQEPFTFHSLFLGISVHLLHRNNVRKSDKASDLNCCAPMGAIYEMVNVDAPSRHAHAWVGVAQNSKWVYIAGIYTHTQFLWYSCCSFWVMHKETQSVPFFQIWSHARRFALLPTAQSVKGRAYHYYNWISGCLEYL